MLAVTMFLTCDALGPEMRVLRVVGSEAMNALPRWTVRVLSEAELDLDASLGAIATLAMADEAEGFVRRIVLVVTGVDFCVAGRDGLEYEVSLSPREWLFSQRSGYRVFQKNTVPEITKELLEGGGIASDGVVFQLSGGYAPRIYCVQYAETEWDFLERLWAEEGISYWFDTKDDAPVLVLGDSVDSHDSVEEPVIVPYVDPADMVSARHFFELEVSEEVVLDAVHVREYDVRKPDVYIEGKAGKGPVEHFEYPACVLDAKGAEARAQVRLEQLQQRQSTASGQSDLLRVQPGRVLTIEGCSDAAMNQSYVVAEVHHEFDWATRNSGDTSGYKNFVRMAPKAAAPRRPAVPSALVTPPPRVEGVEPGSTTGPAGEEIHVNDLGEVTLSFPWDRSGISDDKSSTWARCMQMGMGGAMLLPRVGWEVAVMYVDGNPDKPVVLGRLYNGQGVVPYGLPGAKATTTLQSATSPGGGTTNEIRMGDDAGAMEMFIHASKDQTVVVGGGATTKVGANETHDVGLSLGTAITSTQKHSVGGSQSVDIGTDLAVTVKGARTETVAVLEHNKVTGNRVCSVKGLYAELVGAAYGIQCNQSSTDVHAAYSQLVAGSTGLAAGLGTGESVAGMRGSTVGGMRNIVSLRSTGDAVTGSLTITAGASTVTAGAEVTTKSATSATIHCGVADFKAGKPFIIKAPSITFDVTGSLEAGALSMASGALKSTKGKVKIDGTIKRQGGTKIE